MRESPPRQAFQRARNPLCVDPLVPRVLVIAMPLNSDLLQIIFELRRAHQIPYLATQHREFVRVQHFGAVVFLDQSRQRRQRSVGFRVAERRHEMIHDDGVGATLGLRTFTRIVDHKRIKQRHIAEEHVRRAIRRQRHALARQPLEGSVGAEMDDRIGAPFIRKPPIKCGVVMAGRQVRSVVHHLRIDTESARRLNGNEDIAEPQAAEEIVILIRIRFVESKQGRAARRLLVAAPKRRCHRRARCRRTAPHLA